MMHYVLKREQLESGSVGKQVSGGCVNVWNLFIYRNELFIHCKSLLKLCYIYFLLTFI